MLDWRKIAKDIALTVVPALAGAFVVTLTILVVAAEFLVHMGFHPTTTGLSVTGSVLMMALVIGLMFVIDRKRGVR